MTGLLFLFGLFLALGLFFLAASLLKLPTIGAAKAMLGTVKQEKKAAIWKRYGQEKRMMRSGRSI